jgi:hypothetical protein
MAALMFATFAEAVCQSGEPADLHPHREVLTLNMFIYDSCLPLFCCTANTQHLLNTRRQ